MLTHSLKIFATGAACALVGLGSVHAATETWTLAGGGLDPATYGGDFRPAQLLPDTSHGSYITVSYSGGTGGLGSSGYPDGYGGIYSFFSAFTSFNITATDPIANLGTITFTLLAGGGNPTPIDFLSSDLVLAFNLSNPSVIASSFSKGDAVSVYVPPFNTYMDLFPYTWTWDVSSLGTSDEFSLSFAPSSMATAHVWFQDLGLTQTEIVPEPSALGLIVFGLGLVLLHHLRRRKISST